MFESNSNQEEETIDDEIEDLLNGDDTQTTNGDGDKNDESEVIARINEVTGKNYKSLDDFKKSQADADKALANRGRDKQPAKQANSRDRLVEEFFFDKHPEAKDKEQWEYVEKQAQILKRDPVDLYLESDLLQERLKSAHSKKQEDTDANDRMMKPSNKIDTKVKTEANPYDRDYPNGFAIGKK